MPRCSCELLPGADSEKHSLGFSQRSGRGGRTAKKKKKKEAQRYEAVRRRAVGSWRALFQMDEITASLSTDGDNLVKKKKRGNKRENIWSCVWEYTRQDQI